MHAMAISYLNVSLFIAAFLLLSLRPTEAQVGVSYGKIANNLPSPQDVVNLYRSNNIKAMRLYFPDQPTLEALQGTDIKLMLGVANENIRSIASCRCAAYRWVRTNVLPYRSSISYIVVGNEVDPSSEPASSVAPAMRNIQYALDVLNINNENDEVKVSTAINANLITNSYPPSNGQFKDPSYIAPIIDFMNTHDSPLLVNVYPYFAYANDPKDISLDYALFTSPGYVFTDPNNGLRYQNLFDAMVDSVYAALRRAGGHHHLRAAASESGWPSNGGFGATFSNAMTYNRNLINHVKQGTPLTPGQPIETYVFAMFDENEKQGPETERNFGLFHPNQQSKYGYLSF
ncbi:glucan endo-1,3-beta-glucosidase-like [Chenopodium quinoa]|uniref:Glucan endo-1,3-beta-D-glucosidase n=1 Tax=Chenopodium quinoa TaxID=63459 RepID=A0A803KM99_CHEQI|nr:glucan endo-1,3-beta-glucosidase-like [Chenopodium quinoa]